MDDGLEVQVPVEVGRRVHQPLQGLGVEVEQGRGDGVRVGAGGRDGRRSRSPSITAATTVMKDAW